MKTDREIPMSSLVNVNTSDVDRLRYALIVEASRISLRPTIERIVEQFLNRDFTDRAHCLSVISDISGRADRGSLKRKLTWREPVRGPLNSSELAVLVQALHRRGVQSGTR